MLRYQSLNIYQKEHFQEYKLYHGTAGSKTIIEVGKIVDCTKFIQRDMDATGLGFKRYENSLLTQKSPKYLDFFILWKRNPINSLFNLAQLGIVLSILKTSHIGDVVDMEAYALSKSLF